MERAVAAGEECGVGRGCGRGVGSAQTPIHLDSLPISCSNSPYVCFLRFLFCPASWLPCQTCGALSASPLPTSPFQASWAVLVGSVSRQPLQDFAPTRPTANILDPSRFKCLDFRCSDFAVRPTLGGDTRLPGCAGCPECGIVFLKSNFPIVFHHCPFELFCLLVDCPLKFLCPHASCPSNGNGCSAVSICVFLKQFLSVVCHRRIPTLSATSINSSVNSSVHSSVNSSFNSWSWL